MLIATREEHTGLDSSPQRLLRANGISESSGGSHSMVRDQDGRVRVCANNELSAIRFTKNKAVDVLF